MEDRILDLEFLISRCLDVQGVKASRYQACLPAGRFKNLKSIYLQNVYFPIIFLTFFLFDLATVVVPLFLRFVAAACLERRWDVRAWRCRIFPDFVTLNRLAAVLLVFSFGMRH